MEEGLQRVINTDVSKFGLASLLHVVGGLKRNSANTRNLAPWPTTSSRGSVAGKRLYCYGATIAGVQELKQDLRKAEHLQAMEEQEIGTSLTGVSPVVAERIENVDCTFLCEPASSTIGRGVRISAIDLRRKVHEGTRCGARPQGERFRS